MQISRHWRLNSQRYCLEGVRYQNGHVSLQNRPVVLEVREFRGKEILSKAVEVANAQPVTVTETEAVTVADVTTYGNRT